LPLSGSFLLNTPCLFFKDWTFLEWDQISDRGIIFLKTKALPLNPPLKSFLYEKFTFSVKLGR